MSTSNKLIKIMFNIEQDEDGLPPFSVESVWAEALSEGGFEIRNIPFYAREVSLGDVVTAELDNGVYWFRAMQINSANSMIRILVSDRARMGELCEHLTALGCGWETSPDDGLVAVNVPETVALRSVQTYLEAQREQGWLGYEEPILRQ